MAKKKMNAYADVRGYKIDFGARVMTVNYTFARASAQYGSPEYNLMRTILREIPDMKVVEMAGRKNKTCHHNKHLTYEFMEAYISVQPNAKEMLAIFKIKKTESAPQTSRYAYVREWFVKQFPNYDKAEKVLEQTTTTTTTTVVDLPAKEAA